MRRDNYPNGKFITQQRNSTMNVKINDDCFLGEYMRNHNGVVAALETDKNTGKPLTGASGKTKRFSLKSGGSLFLSPDQYEEVT